MSNSHKLEKDSISIIIPCYNEELGILKSIVDIKKYFKDAEIIVVNDCSTDDTGKILQQIDDIKIIKHTFNKGYGAALKTGMMNAQNKYIAWFDSDNEHKAEDLHKMYLAIISQSNAAIIGERKDNTSGIRKFGKLAIRILARIMGTNLGNDINCGLRIFERSSILPFLDLLPNGFSASLTSTMILINLNLPLNFYKINTRKRLGTSKVIIIDGFQTLVFVLRLTMLFAPIKIFLIPGLIITLIGTIYGIYQTFSTGIGFPTFAAVLVLFGVFFISLGLIADQISQIRLQKYTNKTD